MCMVAIYLLSLPESYERGYIRTLWVGLSESYTHNQSIPRLHLVNVQTTLYIAHPPCTLLHLVVVAILYWPVVCWWEGPESVRAVLTTVYGIVADS